MADEEKSGDNNIIFEQMPVTKSTVQDKAELDDPDRELREKADKKARQKLFDEEALEEYGLKEPEPDPKEEKQKEQSALESSENEDHNVLVETIIDLYDLAAEFIGCEEMKCTRGYAEKLANAIERRFGKINGKTLSTMEIVILTLWKVVKCKNKILEKRKKSEENGPTEPAAATTAAD